MLICRFICYSKGIVAPVILTLSTWHFVAAIYDGNYNTVYVDDNKIGYEAASGLIIKDSNPLTLGLDSPGGREYLRGKLDDIRIYNIALNEK